MTNQDHADRILQAWQTMRAATPEDRIEALLACALLDPIPTETELDIALVNVALEMAQ